jgi:hypothetical protein
MSATPATAIPGVPPSRALFTHKGENGQSLLVWAVIAASHFIAQVIFRRELAPGEFGTLNTALGVIGLMAVPVFAVNQAFLHYGLRPQLAGTEEKRASFRAASLMATETFAWVWGALSLLLILLFLPLLDMPRFSLQLFILINVLVALGGGVSWAVSRHTAQLRLWMWLLVAAAVARVGLAWGISAQAPWAEAGLGAILLAGFILLTPVLRQGSADWIPRLKACQSILDRDFLVSAAATIAVMLGIYLFTNADRIVSQSWFGVATNNNLGLVNWDEFDAYQTAGLLARSLLWGTQPLLWILFAQRVGLNKTHAASLVFFWIYLGALLLGVVMISLLSRPLSQLFCGASFASTAGLVPSLTSAMIPLGLLQALGVFALASRRHHECFVLAGCSVGYALLLYLAGRQPHLMPAYMFGGGLVSSMVVLFVGVVRWGRRQP